MIIGKLDEVKVDDMMLWSIDKCYKHIEDEYGHTVGITTLRRWARNGEELSAYQVGRATLIDIGSLNRYCKEIKKMEIS